jgi:hypothetical protein
MRTTDRTSRMATTFLEQLPPEGPPSGSRHRIGDASEWPRYRVEMVTTRSATGRRDEVVRLAA